MKTRRFKLLRILGATLVLSALTLAAGVNMPLDAYVAGAVDSRPLVIDDVSIIDLDQGGAPGAQTIVIAGARIVYAGPSAAAPIPAAARRVSGKGKFAIPGLWDMHVHTVELSPHLHFPLLIANGVTSVRNMGDGCSFSGDIDCVPDAMHWSASANGKSMLAPRIVASASYHVEELEPGVVASLHKQGERMLKLQLDDDVTAADFNALVSEGRQAGMRVAGHLPFSVDLLAPATQQLDTIEHDTSLLPQCAGQEPRFDGRTQSKVALLARTDPQRCGAVLALMASRSVGYVPTHVASSGQDWLLLAGPPQDTRLRYTAWTQRALWRLYATLNGAGTGEDDRAPLQAWHAAALRLTAQAHTAGVAVMAGSDAIDAYVPHGFGLHDELALMVKAGLTPLDALRAATIVPARHAGMLAAVGDIKPGKAADIVLLSRNPLADIAHAQAIDSVIVNGQLHQRAELDGMLEFVARQARSFGTNCKFIWAMLRP